MRCDIHCPEKGSTGKVIAAIAGACVLAAIWRFVPDIVLAAGITVGVLCTAGIGLFAWEMRPVDLSAPQGRAALPATRAPAALPPSQPRAIEARRVLPGIVLGTQDERTQR